MRARVSGVAVIVVVASTLTFWEGPAVAGLNCPNTVEKSFFVGANNQPNVSTYGSRASISVPGSEPLFCDPISLSSQYSDAWVMIYSPGSSKYQYAQIGFEKGSLVEGTNPPANVRRISFTQYTTPSGGAVTNVYAAPNLGSTHDYSDEFRPSDGKIHMSDNGVQEAVTGNPVATYWDPSYEVQVYNEMGRLGHETWGTSVDPTKYTNIQRQAKSGGVYNWVDVSGLAPSNDNSSKWSLDLYTQPNGGSGMKVWSN